MDSTNDSNSLSMLDAREIVRDLFGYDFPTPKEQAQFWVREAMEKLCGEGHVALACAPRMDISDADVDRMAAAAVDDELYTEGRRHRSSPINPHE